MDYNVYFITSGATFTYLWNSKNYADIAAFRTGEGQEMHGKQQDPKFLDAQLNIDTTSPAYDAGVIIPNFNDVTSAWAFKGAAPDAGAREK
jgi:hypothetical protein